MSGVRIAAVTDMESCRAVEELQREVWGLPDRGLVPAEQVRAIVHNGGMLLLASDEGSSLGFCYAFVGVEDGQPILCSHMLAVRPAASGHGIGTALKLAQRELARERGFAKITWTFDPLQARNAYLNLHRLGAYARRYLVDHYGAMEDDINRGLPSDRLLAEWPLADPPGGDDRARASEPAGGDDRARASASEPASLPWILRATVDGGPAWPGEPDRELMRGAAGRVAVPRDIETLRREDPQLLQRWRLALRATFEAAFAAGLVAVDFDGAAATGVAAYVLERVE
jgi:predicted GNAT superfamily acetyltransferase